MNRMNNNLYSKICLIKTLFGKILLRKKFKSRKEYIIFYFEYIINYITSLNE